MTVASNPAAELTEAEVDLLDSWLVPLWQAETEKGYRFCAEKVQITVERILAARLAAGGAATDEGLRARGAQLIAAERRRQIEDEGYTAEHDAEHGDHALVKAAQCYRLAATDAQQHAVPHAWPWDESSWKPRDPISNLIRAGALYLAAADSGNPWAKKRADECADLLDQCCAALDAAPAPTEDAHRPGCQEYPTGWLCVSDCTTVWHDKPADTAAEEPRTEAQKACCNVREPNGEQCTGQMTKHGPEYVCDTCRARCGSLSHPQHAPSSAIEDIAYCPRCKVLVSRSHQCHLPAVAGEGLLTEAQICHETGDAIAMCCEFMPGGRHVHHPLSRADEEAGSEAQTITQRIGALMKAEREAARAELLSRDTEDQP